MSYYVLADFFGGCSPFLIIVERMLYNEEEHRLRNKGTSVPLQLSRSPPWVSIKTHLPHFFFDAVTLADFG